MVSFAVVHDETDIKGERVGKKVKRRKNSCGSCKTADSGENATLQVSILINADINRTDKKDFIKKKI